MGRIECRRRWPGGTVDTPGQTREKLAVLHRQCEAIGRPADDILRSHITIWLILAPDETALRAKVERYFPDGQVWARAVARTPEGAIEYFQGLVDTGIQHFVVEFFDAQDEETVRLLAERVAPAVRPATAEDAS